MWVILFSSSNEESIVISLFFISLYCTRVLFPWSFPVFRLRQSMLHFVVLSLPFSNLYHILHFRCQSSCFLVQDRIWQPSLIRVSFIFHIFFSLVFFILCVLFTLSFFLLSSTVFVDYPNTFYFVFKLLVFYLSFSLSLFMPVHLLNYFGSVLPFSPFSVDPRWR